MAALGAAPYLHSEPCSEMKHASLINFAVAILTVVLTVGLIEGGTVALNIIAPLPAKTWDQYRLRLPAPYRNVPYNVPEIVSEAKQITWQTGDGFGWLPNDRSGRYINILRHQRVTTDQPKKGVRRIWLFGGSTVMGAEVPDNLTIPSFLQRRFADGGDQVSLVLNVGATTITSSHQLFKLTHMSDVQADDIVIFYDGVNDIIQSLYYQNPSGTMIEANRQVIANLPPGQRLIWWIYTTFGKWSPFVNRFLNPTSPTYIQVHVTEEALARLEDDYFNMLKNASEFSKSRGAKFVHFLQPNIYTVKERTRYEESLIQNGWLYPTNLKDVYTTGYPALRRASQRASDIGIVALDLSDVFDKRRGEIFLDFCHVNEHGNESVADGIYAVVAPMLNTQ